MAQVINNRGHQEASEQPGFIYSICPNWILRALPLPLQVYFLTMTELKIPQLVKKWKGSRFFLGLEIRGPAPASPEAADPSLSLLPQFPGARCGAGGAGSRRAAQPPTPARPEAPSPLLLPECAVLRRTPRFDLAATEPGSLLPRGRVGPWIPGTGTGAGGRKTCVCHGRTDKAGGFRRRWRSEGSRWGPSAPFSATRCVYAATR